MSDSIIKVNDNNINKIVTIGGQILQAPMEALSPATYNPPIATKGTVSNNSIVVTPSFEVLSGGSISNGIISGSPVTVQANELVNGKLTITSNHIVTDVTNYASVEVNVPSSGENIQASKSYRVSQSGPVTISPDSNYTAMRAVELDVFEGTVSSNSSITQNNANISAGTNTITLSKTILNFIQTTEGYITNGTTGNSEVSLTASIPTKAASTITPGTTDQTIASGTYLTGAQTITGDSNLIASNIKNGVSIFGVNGSYTGSGSNSGGYVEDIGPTNNTFTISNVSFSPTKILGITPYGVNSCYAFYSFLSNSGWTTQFYYNSGSLGTIYNNVSYSNQTLIITGSSNSPFLNLSYWKIFYVAD